MVVLMIPGCGSTFSKMVRKASQQLSLSMVVPVGILSYVEITHKCVNCMFAYTTLSNKTVVLSEELQFIRV